MKVEKIAIKELDILSKLMQDYIEENSKLRHLYNYSLDINSFEQAIKDKQTQTIDRELLKNQLIHQYKDYQDVDSKVMENIGKLSNENTFTITTAHQLCLFTGPLYFIYKTVSAIKLCLQLKEKYKNYHFVPVFWLGSEDHDFEEINHLNLYGEKIEWKISKDGAVGRMSNEHLSEVIDQISEKLFRGESNPWINSLKGIFSEEGNYAISFGRFLNMLFGKYGLVILNQDDPKLKKSFSKTMMEELKNETVKNSIKTELDFLSKNYKIQANPRSINLFYMIDGLRERIIVKEDVFLVNNSSIKFTIFELEEELKNHPERFSPNVLLRPLYQESILPNLAYIGGAGELAYWLQLTNLFDSHQTNFPMLVLRDMGLIISSKINKNIEKMTFDKKCLFKNKELLISELVKEASSKDVELLEESDILHKMYKSVLKKATSIDKSLEGAVLGEEKKMLNSLQNLQSKMLRAEKRNHEQLVQKISGIKDRLFPLKKLQERHDNFLPYWIKYEWEFLDFLVDNFDPLKSEIKLIIED